MKKNLIIACSGDDSLHLKWFNENKNYDLCVIYFGDSDDKFDLYRKNSDFCYRDKGEKYHLTKRLIDSNKIDLSVYEYVWLPDIDIEISYESINKLFDIAKHFNISICQPAMDGHVSHQITFPHRGLTLRYTSFVEVLAPMFKLETMNFLKHTFDCNITAHALDFVWPKLLGYPENKIAIIDEVVMTHTRPVGGNYERYEVHPHLDFVNTMKKFDLDPNNVNFTVYSEIKKI